MSELISLPKGVHDILPDDHVFHTFIKKVVRHRLRQAGFRRISTPIFEFTQLFQRGIGDDTDIVSKEMYTFEDRKGRSLTLKPESTAGIMRAYLQSGMQQLPQPVKLFAIEPHFRYDRPQKGRYRQFWQVDFEVMGESDPVLDVEVIELCHKIIDDIGLGHLFTLQINSIGTKECRATYIQALQDYYFAKQRSLCEVCKSRLEKNPLRLLDCKEEDCMILSELAPDIRNFLDKDSKEFYEDVKIYLTALNIPFVENPHLVRGLDYYCHTVFEFWDKSDGAQNAIGGGGRYDGLAETIGGNAVPGVGVAFGIERLIANMKKEKIRVPSKDTPHVFVAQLGKDAKLKCLPLISAMRDRGIKTVGELGKGSMKSQIGLADKFGVRYTVILGITEVREHTAIIRSMDKGTQEIVGFDEVLPRLVKMIGEDKLDTYTPGEVITS